MIQRFYNFAKFYKIMIPYEDLGRLNQPFFEEYEAAFSKTLRSGWYVLGKEVSQFESDFAHYTNTKHCIGISNGLDALSIAIRALNLPSNSEIIVPSNTYIATILSILQNGFKPVLVEPNLATYNIDPNLIEQNINSNTKAIMVVHLYGKSCEMDPILALCKKYNLQLIEDCAQSHGAKYKNKITGSFGIGCFSFYPTKNLGALGDAGSIHTNDDSQAEMFKMLRNYGSKVKYYNELIGFNARLDEVQAAFLNVKLKYLDQINEHKRTLAAEYHKHLKNDFIKPDVHEDFYDVYHIYNIRHEKRDALK